MKNKINLSLKITYALVVVLAVLNIVGSNLLATQGSELEQIRQKTTRLESQNQSLTNRIAGYSSLSYLEKKAKDHNFLKISQPLALKGVTPVAYLNR